MRSSSEGNTLLREITVPNGDVEEFVTFYAQVQVQFERVGGGGFIQNTISESDTGPFLTFTFSRAFAATEPGSKEERKMDDGMRKSYVSAIGATLRKIRELVVSGDL